MAKDLTTTDVSPGDDAVAAWADLVRADLGNLFLDKTVYAESDGDPVTFDLNNGAVQSVTLEGDRQLAVANTKVGRSFVLIIKQDGTGTRVPVWFPTIYWAYDATPVLSIGANKYDVFLFIEISTDTYLGFIAGQDMG